MMEEDWADRAACKGKPIEWFFGGPGQQHLIAKGKRCCAGCPVIVECREEAESFGGEHGTWGVWAGEVWKDGERVRTCSRAVGASEDDKRPVLCGLPLPCSEHAA